MPVRGIRGAVVAAEDNPEEILSGVRALLLEIVRKNQGLRCEDIASVIFTVTDDLQSVFPAAAARQLGWDTVPLMCAREISVPGSLKRVVRVLIHWNTDQDQSSIQHVYLGDAAILRPDLSHSDPFPS